MINNKEISIEGERENLNFLKIAKYATVVKIRLNMDASISVSIKDYVFQLIKRNLHQSMQIFCMDDTKGEALVTLKIIC